MKYKGHEIGLPSSRQVEDCVRRNGLASSAFEIFKFWAERDWLTKKGREPLTLEVACNVANGVLLERKRRKAKASTPNAKGSGCVSLEEASASELYAELARRGYFGAF